MTASLRDDSAVRAANAWAAGFVDHAFRAAGQGAHMHPDMRDEVADIIGRLNARADGKPDEAVMNTATNAPKES